MQIVVLLLLGSIALGMTFDKLDRKGYVAICALILAGTIAYFFFVRFL